MRRLFNFERCVILAAFGVVALAVVLDAQPPVERNESSVAELSALDVERIARRVERLRGLKFRRPAKPQFVDRETAVRLQRDATLRDYPESDREIDEDAIKLLGLLRPDEDLEAVYRAIEGEQVLGFYDPKTARLVVIKGTADKALLELTLAHELTHALEDQHFGLDSDDDPNDDRAIARAALHEGTATEVMSRYATEYLSISELLAAGSGGDTSKLPEYVERTLLFPYLEGQKFIQTFMGQQSFGVGGSWGPVDSLIAGKPPVSSEQILHPRGYAVGDEPKSVVMPDVVGAAGKQWRRVDRSGVGEFDLRQLFEIVGGKPDTDAAAGWGGGEFELWRRRDGAPGCEAPCIEDDIGVLRIAWDSTADRLQAGTAFRRSFEAGLDGRRIEAVGDLGLWSSRGGAIAMIGMGRTTTVVFAPNTTLAAKLAADPVRPAPPATIRPEGR